MLKTTGMRRLFAVLTATVILLTQAGPVLAEGAGNTPMGTSCNHVHDEACGYIEDTADCNHEHDEACGGLSPADAPPLGDSGNPATPTDAAPFAAPVAAPRAAGILTVTFDDNGSGGASMTDNEMKMAIEAALQNAGVDKTTITTIALTGNATEISKFNWRYLLELYKHDSDWSSLTALDLSGMANLATMRNDTVTALGGISRLTALALPVGLTSIGRWAFNGCDSLVLTALPEGVTSIGVGAFWDCTSLALTALPEGLTSIGQNAFYGCTSLALTALPEGVETIENYAFYRCDSLALTALPDGLTDIGNSAFSFCTDLALTALPDGVITIGDSAFKGCTSLALTALPDGVTSIGKEAFYNCGSITLTALPEGITTIEEGAFSGCTSLALTALPEGVTSIGKGAFFRSTSLTQLVLPSGLQTIGDNAFSACTGLSSLTFTRMTAPTLGTDVFKDTASGLTVYIPQGATGYTGGYWDSLTKQTYGSPTVTGQPQPAAVTAGDTATFTVAAVGTRAPSYQWQVNKSGTWQDVTDGTGGKTASYTTPATTLAMDGWQYRCVVKNGSGSDTSAAAALTVNPPAKPAVTFTITGSGGMDLSNPADLVIQASNPALLTGWTFGGVQFARMPDESYGQILTAPGDVSYANGTLTIPAAAFGQHSGPNPLTAGAYRAKITMEFDASVSYAYWVNFTLTDSSGSGGTTHLLTVNGGSGGGNYAAGTQVAITANTAPSGKVFDKWTGGNGGTFDNANSASTTFTMPDNTATVTATYKDTSAPGGTTYPLTVNGGSGSGNYAAGTQVTITANAAPSGKVFDKWTGGNGGTFANANSASTTFTMPNNAATVTATYKSSGGGDGGNGDDGGNDPGPTPTTYTVTFINDGKTIKTVRGIRYNGTVGSQWPSDPSASGYTFTGWYTRAGAKYTSATPIQSDVTLYAGWRKNTVNIGGADGGSSDSGGSGGGSADPGTKIRIPPLNFHWDGERTLTISHDDITALGLLKVKWDGAETIAYTVRDGSVIITFDRDFIDGQEYGDHIVYVEFMRHYGETTVTLAAPEGTAAGDGDNHNPETGGDGAGSNVNDNPDTGGAIYPAAGHLGSLPHTGPQPGDSACSAPLAAVMLLAAGGILFLVLRGRRQKQNKRACP